MMMNGFPLEAHLDFDHLFAAAATATAATLLLLFFTIKAGYEFLKMGPTRIVKLVFFLFRFSFLEGIFSLIGGEKENRN